MKFHFPTHPVSRYVVLALALVIFSSWQQRPDRSELDSLLEKVRRQIDVYALDSANRTLDLALDQALYLGDSNRIRRIYGDRGYILNLTGEYEASITAYKLAYAYAEGLRDSSLMVAFSRSIGLNFQRMGLHAVALDQYLATLELAKNVSDKKIVANLNNSIGVLYQQNNAPDVSMNYLRQALALYNAIGDQEGVAYVYNNMAINFQQKSEFDSCIYYNELALEQKKTLGDLRDISSTFNNLGEIFLDLALLDSAYAYLQEAYSIHRQLNEPESMVISYNNFADYWLKKGDYSRSGEYLDSAAQIIREIQTKELAIKNAALRVQLYEITHRYDRALQTYKIWDSLKTDLFMNEKIQVQELGNMYLLREKEFEKEQVAQQANLFEIKSAQFQTTSLLLGVVGVLLTFFSLITYRNLNTQKQQSKLIQEQNYVIKAQQTEIRHRTSNSLAKIQTVIHTIRRKATDSGTKSELVLAGRILQTAASLERHLYDVEDELEVPLAEYLTGLLDLHRELFRLEKSTTQLTLDCREDIVLPVNQILSLGILLDEWLRNSSKYAFANTQNPQISIQLQEENQVLTLHYRDNGSGLTENQQRRGTGTELIEKFAQDLDATLTTESDAGIHHCLRFKIETKPTQTDV
ncbi:histidine kinase dimerization/phosphoacceptor domain -containing protein [Cyclobacterium xiamenense]|uniref:histidine kinase dimerization/phosphoacceptor domain -containing protein n=1 Tax=Cyclobacterium xiamenense TaxID=1297121 RepID=UPI0012B72876|nr:histidine kinase dimerization/phosphoacceptor domain -containing protein [Cyclobacterium xiamenense]